MIGLKRAQAPVQIERGRGIPLPPVHVAESQQRPDNESAKAVAFHEGRGSQEGIFAERKTHCQMDSGQMDSGQMDSGQMDSGQMDSGQMDYVQAKTLAGRPLYVFAGILAHNLTRELRNQLPDAHRRQFVQQSGTPSGSRPRLSEFRGSGGAELARGRQAGVERRHGRRHDAAPGLPCGEDGDNAR